MNYEVTVRRTIKSPVNEAYKAFTDGDTWSKWFSDKTSVDLRRGGRFSNSDGDTGEYLDIVPNRLLTFTWDGSFAGSRIEIQFKPIEKGTTEVSLRQYLLSAQADAEKMKTCWSWTLASLASFLETGKPVTMDEWTQATEAE